MSMHICPAVEQQWSRKVAMRCGIQRLLPWHNNAKLIVPLPGTKTLLGLGPNPPLPTCSMDIPPCWWLRWARSFVLRVCIDRVYVPSRSQDVQYVSAWWSSKEQKFSTVRRCTVWIALRTGIRSEETRGPVELRGHQRASLPLWSQ
jgi:hypothetical protein